MNLRPQLTHLGIYTHKLQDMERFYAEVIGLVVTDRGRSERTGADLVFMSANPHSHHQFVLVTQDHPVTSSINQISFKLRDLEELKEIAGRLTEAAVASLRPVNHGNAWSVYSTDPEGNGLEFYMDTPWQVAQPHADPLDLRLSNEELLRLTEATVRSDPTFSSREAWMSRFSEELAQTADSH